MRVGEFLAALELAERAATIADRLSDPGANATADWMVGVCRHNLGQLRVSRSILERSLANDTTGSRQAILKQFGYDRRVHVLGVLSQLLWAQGFADQALATNRAALDEAAGRQPPGRMPPQRDRPSLERAAVFSCVHINLTAPSPGEAVNADWHPRPIGECRDDTKVLGSLSPH